MDITKKLICTIET